MMYANKPQSSAQVIDNSRGKVMKGTTSTVQSDLNYQGNVVYHNNASYGLAPLPVQPQNQNQFRQSTVSNQYQVETQGQQRARQFSPRGQLLPQPPANRPPSETQRKNSMDRNDNLKK
jgi:hypothetical protein